MLNPNDWKCIFQVYARDPSSALELAYQFIELKKSLKRGPKGIPDAIAALDQALETLYPHTDFHKLGHRLYHRTIDSTITQKEEDLISALTKSLKRKPIVKTDNRAKKKSHISLVNPVDKTKPAKKRKLS